MAGFLSGLLGGLGGKIGGAASGLGGALSGAAGAGGLLHDQLLGRINTNPGGVIGEINGQTVSAPPSFQREGGVTGVGGLLDKLRAPTTGESVGWPDKLFAIGSILNGDSGGAANYLAGQKKAAVDTADRAKVEARRKAGLEAFAGAQGSDGAFNARDYIQRVLAAGGDLGEALQTAQALSPKVSLQNAGGGGLYEITQGALGGPASTRTLVEPQIKPSLFNPDGTINETFIAGKAQEREAVAAGGRRGAPPVGRSGGGRGKAGKYSGVGTNTLRALLAGG